MLRSEINYIVKLDNSYPEILSFALLKHNTHVTYVTSTQQKVYKVKDFVTTELMQQLKNVFTTLKNDKLFKTGLNIQNYY